MSAGPDIEWVAVDGGSGPLGVDAGRPDQVGATGPAHTVELAAFAISRTPVTNAQYGVFVARTGRSAPAHWEGRVVPAGLAAHPVTYVDWDDAVAFCAWVGGRLPSEAEWERAARGADGRTYPWGEAWPDPTRANCDGWFWRTTPVATLARGAGPGGVQDMAGNVWEWTASLHRPYPYDPDDGREDPQSAGARVVRGGSYLHPAAAMRASARDALHGAARDEYIGFRVVVDDVAAGRDVPGLDWVAVERGRFELGEPAQAGQCGSSPPARPALGSPAQRVTLAPFEIARTPVTNAQYGAFVARTGRSAPAHWEGRVVPAGLAAHPVTYVDWDDAVAFCAWVGGRLPSEAEWERAARGADGRTYPWGEAQPDASRAWFGHLTDQTGSAPVGGRSAGASPDGALDLAGNVWEWTASVHRPFPYDATDGREDARAPGRRVLRGGSFRTTAQLSLQGAFRSLSYPTRRRDHIGFRPVRDLGA